MAAWQDIYSKKKEPENILGRRYTAYIPNKKEKYR